MAKYDELTFGKAFAAARKEMGAGKTFTWKGKSYTTNYKEEATKKPKAAPTTSVKPRAKPKDAMAGYREGDVTTTKLGSYGRGDGGKEMIRRTAEAALRKAAAPKSSTGGPARVSRPRNVTYTEWKSMTTTERAEKGLPTSVIGGEMGFNRFLTGITGKDYTMKSKR